MSTVYNYNPHTGEYLSTSEARPDPLEGKPLVPAYATELAPPAVRENEAAIFKEGVWQIVADFRGLEYWLADGSRQKILGLGERLPEEALLEAPVKQAGKKKAAGLIGLLKPKKS